jgi:hypothetical protein
MNRLILIKQFLYVLEDFLSSILIIRNRSGLST